MTLLGTIEISGELCSGKTSNRPELFGVIFACCCRSFVRSLLCLYRNAELPITPSQTFSAQSASGPKLNRHHFEGGRGV